MRHFLSINDLRTEEIEWILRRSNDFCKGKKSHSFFGKVAVLLFAKPSTRTILSFDVGIGKMGGRTIFLDSQRSQLKRESFRDTARTISQYGDLIVARLFGQEDVVELSKGSSVPVINGLTDLEHPCQAVSDMFTISRYFKNLAKIKLAYFGDGGSNIAHSLLLLCSKLGIEMWIACPSKYSPGKDIHSAAVYNYNKSGGSFVVTQDVDKAAKDADVIYTDVWTSMGEEEENDKRLKEMSPYQVNKSVLKLAKKEHVFMHLLPAHRGEEVTDDVIDGPTSIVWEQAKNRVIVQQAIIEFCL